MNVQREYRSASREHLYRESLPGRTEEIRVKQFTSGYEISVDCNTVRARGSSQEEVVRALVQLIHPGSRLDAHEVFLSCEGRGDLNGQSWQVKDAKGQKRQIGFARVHDDKSEEWTGYIQMDTLTLPPARPLRVAAGNLFAYVVRAHADTDYLMALSRGIREMLNVLGDRFH